MAEGGGGIIKELFVAVGYKLDEGSERRFSSSVKDASVNVAGLNKILEATVKGVAELGRRFTQLSQQPVKDYAEATKKMQRGHEDLAKSFLELSKIAVTAGAAMVAALRGTANEYANLYYLSQRTGTSVGNLKNLQFGFEQIGISAEAATAAFDAFIQAMKLPQTQALFASIVRPEDFAQVKNEFGDLYDTMDEGRKRQEALFDAIGRIEREQGRNAAIAFAEQFGQNIQLIDQQRRNKEARIQGEREANEEAKKLGITRDELAKRSAEQQRLFNSAVRALGTAWEQAFIEISPILTGLLKGLAGLVGVMVEFNQHVPGAAAIEAFAVMAGGAALLFSALNLLLAPLRLLVGLGGGLATLAIGFGRLALVIAGLNPAFLLIGGAALIAIDHWRDFVTIFKDLSTQMGAALDQLGKSLREFGETEFGKGIIATWHAMTDAVASYYTKAREALGLPTGPTVIPPAPTGPPGPPRPTGQPGEFSYGGPATDAEKGFSYGGEKPARYQGGGIVRIDAHDQEMVLPANISRGLQSLFATDKPKMPGDPEDKRTAESLSGWLRGSAAMVPRIIIENVEDFVAQLMRALKGEKEGGEEGADRGEGTGGGRGAVGGAGAPGGPEDKPGEFAGTGKGHGSDLAKQAIQYFTSQGWTHEQAAGIAANIERESNWNPKEVGDSGKAIGLGQWHPDRQAKFKEVFGKDLSQASFGEQLQFVQWELTHTEKAAGAQLRGAKTAGEAAAAVSRHYERPKDEEGQAAARSRTAERLFQLPQLPPAVGRGSADPAAAVDTAAQMLGMSETSDRKGLTAFMKAGGINLDPATAAWCAAFLNANLQQHGIVGSKSNVATSFANWGQAVVPSKITKGDVVVEMRGHQPGEIGGHVGEATGNVRYGPGGEITSAETIAGNVGDRVTKAWVDLTKDVRIRRANEMLNQPLSPQLAGPAQGTTLTPETNMPPWARNLPDLSPQPLSSLNGGNGNGGGNVSNNTEGDRNVTINQTNNTTIAGGDASGTDYARTHQRIHGDLLRNARAALA